MYFFPAWIVNIGLLKLFKYIRSHLFKKNGIVELTMWSHLKHQFDTSGAKILYCGVPKIYNQSHIIYSSTFSLTHGVHYALILSNSINFL